MLIDILVEDGTASASVLAQSVPFTRQAVAKHLDVLRKAGLVRSSRQGNEVQFAIEPGGLRAAALELSRVASSWNMRLVQIKQVAEALHQDSAKKRKGK